MKNSVLSEHYKIYRVKMNMFQRSSTSQDVSRQIVKSNYVKSRISHVKIFWDKFKTNNKARDDAKEMDRTSKKKNHPIESEPMYR